MGPSKAAGRALVRWVGLMSGLFALLRAVVGAYLNANGTQISARWEFPLLGHLALAAFIVCAAVGWWQEHRDVVERDGDVAKLNAVMRTEMLDDFETFSGYLKPFTVTLRAAYHQFLPLPESTFPTWDDLVTRAGWPVIGLPKVNGEEIVPLREWRALVDHTPARDRLIEFARALYESPNESRLLNVADHEVFDSNRRKISQFFYRCGDWLATREGEKFVEQTVRKTYAHIALLSVYLEMALAEAIPTPRSPTRDGLFILAHRWNT